MLEIKIVKLIVELAPASEPEVQAIQNFYKGKKLNMVLDMHAYGEMFFWPVGYSDKDVPEVAVFKEMYKNTFQGKLAMKVEQV
jgi:hypothetical protein